MSATTRPLSDKQMLMARLVAKGEGVCSAYKKAGYKGNPHDCAHQVHGNPRFQRYLAKLRKRSETTLVATREERLKMLSRIMERTEETDPRVAAIASDQLNKLTGEYSVERFQVKVEHSPLQIVMNSLRTNNTIEESAE